MGHSQQEKQIVRVRVCVGGVHYESWILELRWGTDYSHKRTEGKPCGDIWPSQPNHQFPYPNFLHFFFVSASTRTRIPLFWATALAYQNVPGIKIWVVCCAMKYILKLVDVVSVHRWSNTRCLSGSFPVLKYTDSLNEKTINMVSSTLYVFSFLDMCFVVVGFFFF